LTAGRTELAPKATNVNVDRPATVRGTGLEVVSMLLIPCYRRITRDGRHVRDETCLSATVSWCGDSRARYSGPPYSTFMARSANERWCMKVGCASGADHS